MPEPLQVHHWHVAAGADALLPFLQTLDLASAHIVKQGPHRIVYRIRLADREYYLKRHRIPDGLTWFRQQIRPTKARTEFAKILEVARRGIATVRPVAWGKASGSESVLVTEALADVTPLHHWLTGVLPTLRPCEQTRWRQILACALGRFVADIHHAGIRHGDFHAGNLLLRGQPDSLELFLLDLDAASLGQPLPSAQSRQNLGMFHLWFNDKGTRSDRLRFLKAYARTRGEIDWPERYRATHPGRAFVHAVSDDAHDYALSFWQDRDERCCKSNRYYRRIGRGSVSGFALAALDPASEREFLTDPESVLRRPDAKILKQTTSALVVELTLTVNGTAKAFVFKRFPLRHVGQALANAVRPSAALLSWIHGHGLFERGIPTPRPWLMLQRHILGMPGQGYLLAEKVENAVNLHAALDVLQTQPTKLRQTLRMLGRLVARLHACGYSHRDLKANNILFADDRLALIDLVGVRLDYPTKKRRMLNLARLSASFLRRREITRTDRLRVLRSYLQGEHAFAWKKWWTGIERATAEKVRRNRKAGRELW